MIITVVFCAVISALVCLFARPLMEIFVGSSGTEIIAAGVRYLTIEGLPASASHAKGPGNYCELLGN